MSYKYYNQFNLSNELSQSLSLIISEKEGTDYTCRQLLVTIPEHRGLVSYSPEPDVYGGGLYALIATQPDANKQCEKKIEGMIPAENHAYLVVMDNTSFQIFSKLSFKSEDEIKRTLDALSIFCSRYDGIFDSRTLIEKFPYLKEFFDRLDEWRAETGRVTLDDDILAESMEKTLPNDSSPAQKIKTNLN